MSAAIDHLMAQNCSRLIFLGIQKKCAYGAVRLRGIERACRRHGLKSGRDTLFLHLDDRATDSVLDGAALIDLAPPLKPRTGLVALNDAVALGALRRLLELRHTVGHEIKLIGYDDSEFCSSTTPSLSSINPRTPELVQTAAQLLEMAQRHEPTQSRILPRLIARESTLGTQS
jgi:DNA-binding LacI/PurR family transcriptional regulator